MAIIRVLRLIDRTDGVNFHAYILIKNREVRGLFKNSGRRVPHSAVREDLEALDAHGQAVLQLRLRRGDHNAEKNHPGQRNEL